MDRILYFRMRRKKEYGAPYRLQVFRRVVGGKDVFYLQVCGLPSAEQVELLQGEMQKAVDRISNHGKRMEEEIQTSLVYEYDFEKWLEDLECVSRWRRMWHLPVYDAYYERDNVLQMLDAISKEEFPKEVWVVGYGSAMQEWIGQIAGQIKSLHFYVEFLTRSLERMTEELEEEYGLVPQVHLVSPGGLRKIRFRSTVPVLVADYSGTEPVSAIGLYKGSIWLDMDSAESKRHSMEDRRTGVKYISLKKIWKQEMLQLLDTIGNFEYNTGVKLDRLGR